MLHVGSRSDPSVKTLLITVILVVAVAVYVMVSLGTGDWLWWQGQFSATPQAIVVHCFGNTMEINPGSYQFKAINDIVDSSLSGQKRWDPLSLSAATYQDYQTDPGVVVLELHYREPLRIHTSYRYFSNVDNLIIPLEGRHAQTNAIFGQNQGVPEAGSLHIESNASLAKYLSNMGICPVSINSSN